MSIDMRFWPGQAPRDGVTKAARATVDEMSDEVEARIRSHLEGGAVDAAVAAAIDAYGPEVFGFLVSRLRDEDVAGDVFSQTCEDLWRTIARFEWRCSMRTWLYKLARSSASHHERSPHNRGERKVRLSQVSAVADRVRSRTVEYLRTEVKDGFARLREELDPDDQALLTLRVDKNLDWNDIARVLADDDLEGEALTRASARLRQRFKTLKERLRERAVETGLIPPPDEA
jgi:RNA polymerase sigma-70 factor (ECF subfamily)